MAHTYCRSYTYKFFKDRILNQKDLPIRLVAQSSCYRSEAGSAGQDTKGMIRLHEFKKVELVSLVEKINQMRS